MPPLGPGSRDMLPASQAVFDAQERTATETSEVYSTQGASGLIVVIDVSAVTDTPSVVFTVQGVAYPAGPAGRKVTWDLVESVAVTAANATDSPVVLQVHPALVTVENLKTEALVPDRIQVVATHADADPITYTVTVELVP